MDDDLWGLGESSLILIENIEEILEDLRDSNATYKSSGFKLIN